MSKQSEQNDTLVKLGLGIATILIAKNAFDHFFGGKSEAEQEIDDLPRNENPFNINYLDGAETILMSGDFFDELNIRYQLERNEHDVPIGMDYWMDVAIIAYEIYDSFSFWKGKDTAKVLAAFNMVQTKSQLADVAGFFQMVWDTDLWNYLKHGFQIGIFGNGLTGGLSDEAIGIIVEQVKELPETSDQSYKNR